MGLHSPTPTRGQSVAMAVLILPLCGLSRENNGVCWLPIVGNSGTSAHLYRRCEFIIPQSLLTECTTSGHTVSKQDDKSDNAYLLCSRSRTGALCSLAGLY